MTFGETWFSLVGPREGLAKSLPVIRGTKFGGGRDWSKAEKVDLVGLGSADLVYEGKARLPIGEGCRLGGVGRGVAVLLTGERPFVCWIDATRFELCGRTKLYDSGEIGGDGKGRGSFVDEVTTGSSVIASSRTGGQTHS